MFHSSVNPASLYQQVSLDSGVYSADPHRLIEMLYEGADDALATADRALEQGDLATKGEAITRVIRILDEGLRASLNHEGGELAGNLGRLYDYMLQRLLVANQKNSREVIQEVRGLLGEVRSAWSAIAPGTVAQRAARS